RHTRFKCDWSSDVCSSDLSSWNRLYFRDKESLFQELVRAMVSPLVGAIAAAPLNELPIRAVVEMIVDLFVKEIYGTRRRDVLRRSEERRVGKGGGWRRSA